MVSTSTDMQRCCVICGAGFATPPSSKRLTCSPSCATTRRRQAHQGKPHPWSAAARARLREKGRTPNLTLGTPAALTSPRAGPVETHHSAKIWRLRNLNTQAEYEVRNLNKFCRDHPALWTPDPWQRAVAGLRQVQASLLGKRRRSRPVSRWKNWTLIAPAAAPPAEREESP